MEEIEQEIALRKDWEESEARAQQQEAPGQSEVEGPDFGGASE